MVEYIGDRVQLKLSVASPSHGNCTRGNSCDNLKPHMTLTCEPKCQKVVQSGSFQIKKNGVKRCHRCLWTLCDMIIWFGMQLFKSTTSIQNYMLFPRQTYQTFKNVQEKLLTYHRISNKRTINKIMPSFKKNMSYMMLLTCKTCKLAKYSNKHQYQVCRFYMSTCIIIGMKHRNR